VYEAISVEEFNTPIVALCNKDFLIDARSAASSKGMPGLQVVAETVPCECNVIEQIDAGVNAAMDDIIAALTKPLTEEERSPKPKEVEKPTRIVFRGNLEEVNRFFYRRGFTDGLPIIPPTEEAVAEMLTGTELPADHVVAKIIPRLGKATVEKIAINAVMAGALPIYMPVLIAGVQAVMDSDSGFISYEVSTGSFIPFWIINGPIRKDLNVNSGQGALSPGDIANAAIGRAMGLIIKNMGGARKGVEDMGTLGNPGKYTMVIAENEEESPWEPLHVERGFKKEDSTVTVSFPNSFWQLTQYGSDDKGILRAIIYNLHPSTSQLCLMFTPTHARFLASTGWTKREIATYISQHTRAPVYRFTEYYGNMLDRTNRMRDLLMNPEDSISIINNPDSIWMFVGGGSGMWIGAITGPMGRITKKVELPSNWDKLVQKYKDIVPTYARY
jgi:hypothetical protein